MEIREAFIKYCLLGVAFLEVFAVVKNLVALLSRVAHPLPAPTALVPVTCLAILSSARVSVLLVARITVTLLTRVAGLLVAGFTLYFVTIGRHSCFFIAGTAVRTQAIPIRIAVPAKIFQSVAVAPIRMFMTVTIVLLVLTLTVGRMLLAVALIILVFTSAIICFFLASLVLLLSAPALPLVAFLLVLAVLQFPAPTLSVVLVVAVNRSHHLCR